MDLVRYDVRGVCDRPWNCLRLGDDRLSEVVGDGGCVGLINVYLWAGGECQRFMEGRDGVVGGKWTIVDGNWEVIADRPSLWDRSSRLDWEWAKDACGHLGMIEWVLSGVHFCLF